jgi:hypothetical protein
MEAIYAARLRLRQLAVVGWISAVMILAPNLAPAQTTTDASTHAVSPTSPMPNYDVAARCAREADQNSCVSMQYVHRGMAAGEWLAASTETRTECAAASRWQDYATLYNCLAAHKLDAQVVAPALSPPPGSQAAQLEVTLGKLRQLQRQATPKPQPKGVHDGIGQQGNNDGAGLTAAQRETISNYVRRCWSTDPGMLDLDQMEVLLTVTADSSGVVRRAVVSQDDVGRIRGNPRLHVFSERAVRAVLDPNCANLPLPPSLMGRTVTLTFPYRP